MVQTADLWNCGDPSRSRGLNWPTDGRVLSQRYPLTVLEPLENPFGPKVLPI